MIDGPILLAATPLRRWMALLTLAVLAFLCLYMVFNAPFSVGLTVIGLTIAAGAFWAFVTMYRGTQLGIELRDTGLFLTDDTLLAALDDIEKIDRGTFSVKPTNGFTVILKDKAPFSYVPGLYWRLGRKLGIGGVTAPQVAKYMAEALTTRVLQNADRPDGRL